MTDITINIKAGSENSEPKITTTTDNAKIVVPKVETPKSETMNETASEKEASNKDDPKKMDMTEEEHAKMGAKK
jgi:hypothetical protein